MNGAERRARTIFHAANRVVALAVSACLLTLLGAGIGGVPALGRALVPGHGAWRFPSAKTLSAAAAARRVKSPGAQPAAVLMPGAFVSTVGDLALDLGGRPGHRETGAYLPMPGAGAGTAASSLAISRELRP
jgi:hypothetical protein